MKKVFKDYLEVYVKNDNKNLTGNISPGSILVSDPLLQSLVLKLNELENKKKSQSNLSKEDNPLMVSLNTEIANTKASLSENIKSLKTNQMVQKFEIHSKCLQIYKMHKDVAKSLKSNQVIQNH